MSELAKKAREQRTAKAKRYARVETSKVDASDFSPAPALDTEVKTGMRPVSRRQFKRGGKVEGEKAHHHAGRKPRKKKEGGGSLADPRLQSRPQQMSPNDFDTAAMNAKIYANDPNSPLLNAGRPTSGSGDSENKKRGGRTKHRASGGKALTADSYVNRNEKEANEHRDGAKHVGGMKRGGKAHKAHGGSSGPRPEFGKLSDSGLKEARSYWNARKMQAESDKTTHPEAEKNLADLATEAKRRGLKRGGKAHKLGGGALGMLPDKDAPGGVLAGEFRKRGGKAMKHDDVAEDKKLIKSMVEKDAIKPGKKHGGEVHPKGCRCEKCWGGMAKKKGGGSVTDGKLEGTRPTGGRKARKHGGRARGKTNINIVIAPHAGHQQPQMPPPGMMPPGGPAGGLHQGVPHPPMPMPAGGPPGAGGPPPPMAPPPGPMGRKRGGRVHHYPLKDGSGGGKGRLEKIKAYGLKPA